MKNTLIILSLGFILLGCGGADSSEIEELKHQNEQLSKKLDELIDKDTAVIVKTVVKEEETKSNNKVREEICERWDNGGKKIVCFKEGYGSNEEITRRIYYNSDQLKIGIENYKSGKLDGKFYSWDIFGNKQYEIEFKEDKFNGTYKSYENGVLDCHVEFENNELVKTIKGNCDESRQLSFFIERDMYMFK